MVPVTLKYTANNTIKNKSVLILSGGYDPRHDDEDYMLARGDANGEWPDWSATSPDYGNAIYIIDPNDGKLL